MEPSVSVTCLPEALRPLTVTAEPSTLTAKSDVAGRLAAVVSRSLLKVSTTVVPAAGTEAPVNTGPLAVPPVVALPESDASPAPCSLMAETR